MSFNTFKKAMQEHFTLMLAQGNRKLFVTNVHREHMWETYLNAFPENERQEHNCNACKSFIRQYGNIVTVINGRISTIWDFPAEGTFANVALNLGVLVSGAPISDIFVTNENRIGVDKNHERKEDNSVVEWHHMCFHMPRELVQHRSVSLDTLRGDARTTVQVFKRSLDEIKLDVVDTVLELIAQNSLYRGQESKHALEVFRSAKEIYVTLTPEEQQIWCWVNSAHHGSSVSRIRNTAMGTLLVNLSEGMDLDTAVGKFEQIMAPANYKRPTAIITQKMIEQAESTIHELGYAESLGRRFATVDDISVNDTLFVDRNISQAAGSLLGDLKETVGVNPKSLTKVEEIPVDKFISDVLPKVNSVEVLFENRHVGNLVSLVAPKTPAAPSMFKWGNGFSWSYKDAVADSMKEKVKAAGGRVEGELRVSLEWYNYDDLDLHVVEPTGGTTRFGRSSEIYFSNKRSEISGGTLDVDANGGGATTREPVENIIFPSAGKMQEGLYKVYVNQFHRRETIDTGFAVEVECQGELFTFTQDKSPTGKLLIATFDYSRTKGIRLVEGLDSEVKGRSRTAWGVETNKFHKASMILKSPNYWGSSGYNTGNAHVFFVLDEAHNDEVARGFFNEFLKPELEQHKRVFEALGSRMKVDPADKQVSGLGFSSTIKSDVIVRVGGNFNRTLKIKF